MTWVRVRDKTTGHEYDVRESALDPNAHEKLESKDYPDLTGELDAPRPTKHRVMKDGTGPKTEAEAKSAKTNKDGG